MKRPYVAKKREFVPGVLVVKEKHGTAYFHVPDEATLHKVALSILTGRQKAGYWYYAPEKPKAPDYTEAAEIGKLRGDTQKRAFSRLGAYKRELAEYERDMDEFKDIQKAVETKDGALAWQILRNRAGGEYEGVTFEPYSTTYAGES